MQKTRNETDVRKYRKCKRILQKLERQLFWSYVNNIIEFGDQDSACQPKQKRFWSYIKSLRKDSSGIAPLKDNGRLFNSSTDKANILNHQYLTHERTPVQPLQTQMEPLYLTWTISLSQNKELRSFYRKATHRKQLDLT